MSTIWIFVRLAPTSARPPLLYVAESSSSADASTAAPGGALQFIAVQIGADEIPELVGLVAGLYPWLYCRPATEHEEDGYYAKHPEQEQNAIPSLGGVI